jgi:integrase
VVRVWHAELLGAPHPGASTVAKAYRLLRGILNTAVADALIARNPCVIPGAGIERPAERPTADIAEVIALADALGLTFRAMVFVATFCGLRLGEMQALRWEHIDSVERTIRVVEQTLVLKSGKTISGPPKTEAGVRTISVPPVVLDELEAHRGRSAHTSQGDLVFGRRDGRPLRRATFYKHWRRAVAELGLGDFHLHDLRHTGNTLAAATGASTKELMTRMGHASPRAALIYQHATRKRDQEIADGLQRLVDGASGCPVDADPPPANRPEVQAADERDPRDEVG